MTKKGYKQTLEHVRKHSGKKNGMFGRTGAKHPMFGKKAWNNGLTKETDLRVKKISERVSGENNGMFGRTGEKCPMYEKLNKWGNHTEEAKKQIGEKNSGENNGMFGKGHLISGEKNGMFGKTQTEEARKLIGEKNSGKNHGMYGMTGEKAPMFGKSNKWGHHTKESKEQQRISRTTYIKDVCGNIYPNIGRNEKRILDEIAKSIGYIIIRQKLVNGYFLDGYVKELNLAIEVDEKRHRRKPEKDKIREANIKKELNCSFIRIPDY